MLLIFFGIMINPTHNNEGWIHLLEFISLFCIFFAGRLSKEVDKEFKISN